MANVLQIGYQTSWYQYDVGKYEPGFTYVYFDEDEVVSFSVENDCECTIGKSNVRLPTVYDRRSFIPGLLAYDSDSVGFKYKLTLNIENADTRDKIDAILACKNLFYIGYGYYELSGGGYYAKSTGNEISLMQTARYCVIKPSYELRKYHSGKKAARNKISLEFYSTENAYEYLATRPYRTDGQEYYYQVVIDPDGENITIDGLNDVINISPLSTGFDIEPQRFGNIELNDIYITFNNYKHYFENFRNATTWEHERNNPARIAFWRFEAAANPGDTQLKIRNSTGSSYGDIIPKVYDSINLIDSSLNIETRTIISEEIISGQDYYTVTLNSPITGTYTTSDYLYLNNLIGKKVSIKLVKIQNEPTGTQTATVTTIFKGVVREPFTVSDDSATIKVDNILPEILNKPLTHKTGDYLPLYIIKGGLLLQDSVLWTTQTGSGTLDYSKITLYDGATPGKWEITFSSDTNFTVSGPSCNAKAGSTASIFYDQTDASDSQIKIDTTAWGGAPASDDVVVFYVSVNYEDEYVPTIIHDLIVTHGLSTDENLTTTDEGVTQSISFYKACTIGEAIASILSASDFVLTTDYLGRFILTRLKKLDTATETSNFNTIVELIANQFHDTYKLSYSDIYNSFTMEYNYDYYEEAYKKIARYPDDLSSTENISNVIFGKKRTLSIQGPGYQSLSNCLSYMDALYKLYAFGMRVISFETTLYSVDKVNPGDIINVDFAGSYISILITTKEIDFANYSIKYTGYSQEDTFNNL